MSKLGEYKTLEPREARVRLAELNKKSSDLAERSGLSTRHVTGWLREREGLSRLAERCVAQAFQELEDESK